MPYVIRVEKSRAESVRRSLAKRGILNSRWKITLDGDYLLIPVTEKISGAFEMALEPREGKKSPYRRILDRCAICGDSCNPPDYWERIGDVVLLPALWNYEGCDLECLGAIYAEEIGARTVALYDKVSGEYREQAIRILYGSNTVTVHTENGLRYMLDVSRIMFSSGNVNERIRMAGVGDMSEIVVDMFAGIGYFTLPVSRNVKKVYACEKNPLAYYYLLKNLRLNGISNVYPLFGDNRVTCPERVANRIIMGYFGTEPFFPYALRVLAPEGGTIHYHDLVRENDTSLLERLRATARREGFTVSSVTTRIIKSYAPRVWHTVYDMTLTPLKKIK